MYLAHKQAFSICAIWILVVVTLLGTYRPVQAANTLEVTIFEDEYDDVMWGKGCSLREAIQAAYKNDKVGGCEADSNTDTIYLPTGEYSLSISGGDEDNGLTGDLDIRDSITILGDGPTATKISAAELDDRVFHILGGAGSPTVKISELEISGGWAYGSTGGSGIKNQGGILHLNGAVVSGNSNLNRVGGGINNTAGSVLVVTGSTISGNTGSVGGGIFNAGAVTVVDSTITGNTAGNDGGGLSSYIVDTNVGFTQITRSTFSLNHVNNDVQGAGISSNGRLTIQEIIVENNTGIGLLINSGSIASITSSQFRGNTSIKPEYGAGVANNSSLQIHNSEISGNNGTGMSVTPDGTATVTIVKTNISQNSGLGLRVASGAIITVTSSSVTGNRPADPSAGAGLASAGSLTLNNSTIANNEGIGVLLSGGSAVLTNTTIGANNALVEPGIANSVGIASAGSLSLRSSTIADHAGVGLRVDGGAAEATGTLFARNVVANCTMAGSEGFISGGYNLREPVWDTVANPCPFGGEGDLAVEDAGLADQITDNGGYTQTYALLDLVPQGPAVDAIDNMNSACLAADQRGFGRPVDGNIDGDKDCDIGAFELGATGFSLYLPVVRR